jgi:hypothetical protein
MRLKRKNHLSSHFGLGVGIGFGIGFGIGSSALISGSIDYSTLVPSYSNDLKAASLLNNSDAAQLYGLINNFKV